jgi:hypothetical protein
MAFGRTPALASAVRGSCTPACPDPALRATVGLPELRETYGLVNRRGRETRAERTRCQVRRSLTRITSTSFSAGEWDTPVEQIGVGSGKRVSLPR